MRDYVSSGDPLLAGIRFPKPRPEADVEWPLVEPISSDHWTIYGPPIREGVTALDIGGVWVNRFGGFDAVRGGRIRSFNTRQAGVDWIWAEYLKS